MPDENAPLHLETKPGSPPPGSQVPPPAPAHFHQLTAFPVAAVVLLHYCTCGIFTLVWLNLMHGKLPRVRPDDPSAGRAVGFCFIPFFNLYWIFFTYRRLCLRIDEQRELYGLPPSNLRGLATINCIFQIIPYINALLGLTVVMPLFVGMVQSSVNQLVDKSATTAPKGTLPVTTAPAAGIPGWAIALIVCCCLVIPAILAAMLLPALAAAKRKASIIQSRNNLKQIGISFRIWEGDHNDQYPFNVDQAHGGVKELCETNSDGIEKNPVAVFMVMSNELMSTKLLVCPNDPEKQPAADFASLTAQNISYEIRSGPDIEEGHPEEILAIDPINGLVLYCDGSVLIDRHYKK